MAEYTDEEILELCKNENTFDKGYRILVKKYSSRTYWHIRRMIIDHDDANDVTQDVFVKVWKNLDEFRGDCSLFSWIYRIATNESLNFIRRSKKNLYVPLESTENYLENQLHQSDFISGDEIIMRLQKAIIKPPERQRVVFNMRYYDDLSYNQMSEILKITTGSLKASYHHAVKKIEEILAKE
jgi:RNA polymerase sigma factor (sigma-70 family)